MVDKLLGSKSSAFSQEAVMPLRPPVPQQVVEQDPVEEEKLFLEKEEPMHEVTPKQETVTKSEPQEELKNNPKSQKAVAVEPKVQNTVDTDYY